MKSYQSILGEIRRLQSLAVKRRRKEVAGVIAEIRRRMADYDITVEELGKSSRRRAAKGKKTGSTRGRPGGKKSGAPKRRAKRSVPAKYRDPKTGAKWSGRGLAPRWLAEKEKAGAKREEFLIQRK